MAPRTHVETFDDGPGGLAGRKVSLETAAFGATTQR